MVCVLIQGIVRHCFGLHLDKKDRLCIVCKSSQYVYDEHHLTFDWPMYSHIRARHASFFNKLLLSDFLARCEPMHVVVSLGAVLPIGAIF